MGSSRSARDYKSETRRRNELARERGFKSYAHQRRHAGTRGTSAIEVGRLPAPAREARLKALTAVDLARQNGQPLAEAAQQAGTSVAAVTWWAGAALDNPRSAAPRPVRADRLVRPRMVVAEGEARVVMTRGSGAAKLAADAWTTQQRYLRGRATEAELAKFRGKRVAGLLIETDPALLDDLARTGELVEVFETYRALI